MDGCGIALPQSPGVVKLSRLMTSACFGERHTKQGALPASDTASKVARLLFTTRHVKLHIAN